MLKSENQNKAKQRPIILMNAVKKKNFKITLKDKNNQDILYSWMERMNTVKMTVLAKLM